MKKSNYWSTPNPIRALFGQNHSAVGSQMGSFYESRADDGGLPEDPNSGPVSFCSPADFLEGVSGSGRALRTKL